MNTSMAYIVIFRYQNAHGYIWLSNAKNLKPSQHEKLVVLSQMNLKTASAYRIKPALQDVYLQAKDRVEAMRLLSEWHRWAAISRIEPY